jgi:hypothetical protein
LRSIIHHNFASHIIHHIFAKDIAGQFPPVPQWFFVLDGIKKTGAFVTDGLLF